MSLNRKLYGKGLIGDIKPGARGPLKDKFLFPPFSVWNTRDGFWQNRRDRWLALGIESELGRKDGLTYSIPKTLADGSTGQRVESQTSIFDPCVAELAYRWWCPPGGVVLDPFAGGSVRGIVASVLGLWYAGCDLSKEQVLANRAQLNAQTTGEHKPQWIWGDSYDRMVDAPACDFVFSCPPYGNLEKYSNNPLDISSYTWLEFIPRYSNIIIKSCNKLRNNRFACFVVANFRDPKTGIINDLVAVTCDAFRAAGLGLYNEIVLVNCVGTGAMRTNTNFVRGNRKVVKLHQNVLVFVKGDPAKAAEACGEL